MSQRVQRWAPLTGPLFVVLIVLGFVVSGNSPDQDSSQAKIAAYLGDDSNYHDNVPVYFFLLVAILLLLVFLSTLRSRLVDAEGAGGSLSALAFGAGVASAVLLFVGISLFLAPTFAAHDARGSQPLDPGFYRFSQDLGYLTFVASSVVGSLTLWATSAVAMRTGVLPRWFAWFGIVAGVICLASVVFLPIFLYYLWIVIAGILLVRSPAVPVVAVSGPVSSGGR